MKGEGRQAGLRLWGREGGGGEMDRNIASKWTGRRKRGGEMENDAKERKEERKEGNKTEKTK